jgi:hypothetical protein
VKIANIEAKDRARGLRATLGFLRGDSLALDAVLTETAEDTNPGATGALILALVEQAATYASAAPDAEEQIAAMLLDYAKGEADRG